MNRHLYLLAAMLIGGVAHAQTTTAPYRPGYTYKVETAIPGQQVYISGQRPYNANGQLVGPGNLARQTTQVFENLKTALAEFGMTLANVKQITYHVKGDTSRIDPVTTQLLDAATNDYVTQASNSTPIQSQKAIPKIVSADVLIEIEVIAAK
ncbi:RidA family protein [Spirosoma rhododendri]|uniref:RidA family protein n=1 Tax=Spirosoma rhododendri TaxID=2728024 RepID=A0A7L5DQB8_9BACT|nr:RidA family protein [Spirosoma rhododendri]QJD80596.1 RidA family protein [Spirosoma rhododendri]